MKTFSTLVGTSLILLVSMVTQVVGQSIPDQLQKTAVTIKAGGSEGSGVIVTRQIGADKVNFVWTAGHVVDGLRQVRDVVDSATGQSKKAVVFNDAAIVKELNENGRRVGEVKFDASVVKFSNADTGEDLALLMVRKKNFIEDSATFYLGEDIPSTGTELWHVGSLLGQMGANSCTDGVLSQIGRVHEGKTYDQTSVVAFPGSSGGGVYDKDSGAYRGMLVRGAGEGFNLIVPVRRMKEWSKENGILWALDPSVPTPTLEEIQKIPVEDKNAAGSVVRPFYEAAPAPGVDEPFIDFLDKDAECQCGDSCGCVNCQCGKEVRLQK